MDRLIPDISSELKMKGPVLHREYESLSFVLRKKLECTKAFEWNWWQPLYLPREPLPRSNANLV